MAPDSTEAMFALIREVRDSVVRLEEQIKPVEQDRARIRDVELEQARQAGAIAMLRWVIPGGPVAVAIIAGVAIYATTR